MPRELVRKDLKIEGKNMKLKLSIIKDFKFFNELGIEIQNSAHCFSTMIMEFVDII